MRHAVPFAQVLDDAVVAAAATRVPRPAPGSALPRAIGFFEFTVRGAQPPRIIPTNRSTYRIVAETGAPGASNSCFHAFTPRSSEPVIAKRSTHKRLTAAQRHAVDEMRALGACLDPDFSDDDLRGAYRQLARRYHPDRHPGSSEREKATFGALFARAHASYQLLLERDTRL